MPVSILRRPTDTSHRLEPVEPRYAPLFCFALLTVACALASFAFACATPFAAFAVVAAATLPLAPALLVTLAAWLVNQAIGFGFLHYPIDATTIIWGLVIGGAALAATAASMAVLRLTERTGTVVALAAALIGAYAAYELVLFAATPFLGGAEDFTAAIVGRLGLLSVIWTIGLVAACEVARLLNHALRRQTAS
jgi:membrane-associated HD superfamily phosphohydrolase